MARETSIIAGRTRFQFYSDSLVRIEHSPSSFFRDWPTAVVPNREPDGTKVDQEWNGGELVLRTSYLTIRCTPDRRHIGREHLNVEWICAGERRSWRLGDVDENNLGGTLRGLDGNGAGNLPDLPNGILSRSHYFVLDDTVSPTIEPYTGKLYPQLEDSYWDIYFFAYDNFTSALRMFADLTSRVPMIPRWALGFWYSRYYPYSSEDFIHIADQLQQCGMPLDVMVLDVDWHKYGWEGYDWDTDLIPHPSELINWLHENGMKVSLNVHPAGVPDADSHAPAMRKALGIGDSEAVICNLADPKHARAYMEILHGPLMDIGVDVWWIDGAAAVAEGLDSQHWTNRIYYNFTRAHSQARPIILSRFGGLGSQRYPIGFSGDVKSDWVALKYEVSFTSTAGNALMPYWSHDIGGFTGLKIDPQLYVRWFQFGTMSPFLRVHSDHGVREPWEYPTQAQDALKKAFNIRKSLIPFLYSLCYQASQDSLPLVRPMYYTWPDDEKCYVADDQYTLGDSIMVRPVTHYASDGLAHIDIYLPEGTWYDFATGERYDGGCEILYSCPLDRMPAFVRAGAIIAAQEPQELASVPCPDPLIIHLYAGGSGEFLFYEDDGTTQANEKGVFATARMSFEGDKSNMEFNISPSIGSFHGWKAERDIQIHLHGIESVRGVKIGGEERKFDYAAEPGECHVAARIDFKQGAKVVFGDCVLVPAHKSPSESALEVSIGLVQGDDNTAPELILSALGGVNNETLHLSVDVPAGWGIRRTEDDRPQRRVYELQVPKVQQPGCYCITATASLPGTAQSHAQIDWEYASVTDFKVIGTFDNKENYGMDIAYEPEVDFGYHEHVDGRSWTPLNEDAIRGDIIPVRYIDLTRHFGWISDVVAYAVTYIHSASERDVIFALGSDDGIAGWLNGKEFLRAPEPGPAAPGQFSVPVKLRKGWNQVLLKIGQLFGDWGFYFEVKDPEGKPAENLRVSTQPD